jgi:hypothetical protein
MRSADDIEKSIKNLNIAANTERHRRILGDLLKVMETSKKERPPAYQPIVWRIIMNNRMTKLAAVAVIIVAVSVGLIQLLPSNEGMSGIETNEGMSGVEITAEIPAEPKPMKVEKMAEKLFDYSAFNTSDESSLPQFYEILKDENISGYEVKMTVTSIGMISKRGNKQTVKELLDYYKRSVNWDKFLHNDREIDKHVFAKFAALNWMGFIGGNDVEEILKKAMTVDGCKELAKEWYVDVDMPPTTYSTLDHLRGHAAMGLAYSEKQEVQDLIKAEYEKERKICLDAGKTSGGYINLLTDAMARIDIVKDIGLEAHRKLYGEGSLSNLYQVYIRKYLLFEAGPPVRKQL